MIKLALIAGGAVAGLGLGVALERRRWLLTARRRPATVRVGERTYWIALDGQPCDRCGCEALRSGCVCMRRPSARVAKQRVQKVVRRHSA
jgi:hypothetical protein